MASGNEASLRQRLCICVPVMHVEDKSILSSLTTVTMDTSSHVFHKADCVLRITRYSYFNLAATGPIGGLFEVPGESKHFKAEPVGLCQRCVQGNGVLGVTKFCT